MSLATRCPACGTVFRVVQDQLKVSGGWVRCGQCHEVFNGLQTLFELPADPPAAPRPPAPPAAPPPGLFVTREAPPPASDAPDTWEATEPVALDEWPEAETPMVDLADLPDEPATAAAPEQLIDPDATPAPAATQRVWAYTPRLADDDPSEAETVMPADAADGLVTEATATLVDHALEPAPAASEDDAVEHVAAEYSEPSPPAPSFVISQPPALPAQWTSDAKALADDVSLAPAVGPREAAPQAQFNAEAEVPAAAEVAPVGPAQRRRRSKSQRKPAFMRQAERAARWRSTGVRAVLGGTSFILGLMLAMQVVHHHRDDVAARWPATHSALATWCQWTNCQLKAPRALASITLDSSALSKTARPQVLRFEAELRNSASHAVMAPALDVSFTDNLGHQLARKVLLAEQLGATTDGLAPNQTWRIEVPLEVGDLQIAGFTAEVFYP